MRDTTTDPLLAEANRAATRGMRAYGRIVEAKAKEARRVYGTRGHLEAVTERHAAERALAGAYSVFRELERRMERQDTA